MGKTNGEEGEFKAQKPNTIIPKIGSRKTASICGGTSGCLPKGNCNGNGMFEVEHPKSDGPAKNYAKKKQMTYQEQDAGKVAAYKKEIAGIPPENIAYVDETGIDSYLYRKYGYAPRGKIVVGRIRGRRYARTGIVAAKMGNDILAPCSYNGTMNHGLFEDWFEKQLLPVLPKGTAIVMDNASFHRKNQLRCLAQKYECTLIFLPPYSPEFNPIEHFWAWLKHTLSNILPLLPSLDDAIFAAFYFREQLALN